MHIRRHSIIAALALVAAAISLPAQSQERTLTFAASTTTGAGSVIPVLTWSTSPAAASCTASGDTAWTGTKAASGTATLAAITSSKTYQLSCTWPGDTQARLTWVAPTANTDGSALAKCTSQTDTGPCLRSFIVNKGTSATELVSPIAVNDRNATSYTWTGLTAGTHFFGVEAVTGQGVESALSNVVSKVITSATSVNRNVAITVNPQPNAPTNLTVE